MPGLSSLNKILKAVKAGDISPSYARKAKASIGKKPKRKRPDKSYKNKPKSSKPKRVNVEKY